MLPSKNQNINEGAPMSLQAKIHTDSRGNITVHMEGGLDFETSIPFRNQLADLMSEYPSSNIVLDMNRVDFVGSSGIGLFVETLKILKERRDQIKLSNVKTEFIKVFKLYNFDPMQALIHEFETDDTQSLNTMFGNRQQTFEQ